MTKVRILIATTRGPSAVERITPEDAMVRSVVCLGGRAVPLPISAAYENFVRAPTGVVERDFGHPSFRLDVEQPIDDGSSWQLGAYVAHALFAVGRLAGKGEPCDTVVLCTGEVDRDLAVLPVDHVPEKLERSTDTLHRAVADGARVVVLVPNGDAKVVAMDWARACGFGPPSPVLAVATVDEALGVIGLAAKGGTTAPRQSRSLLLRFSVAALILAAIVVGTILTRSFRSVGESQAVARIEKSVSQPEIAVPAQSPSPPLSPVSSEPKPGGLEAATAGSRLDLGVAELRAADGQSCPASLADITPLRLNQDGKGRFPVSRLDGLCGLELSVTNRGAPAHVWGFAQLVPEKVFLLADAKPLETSAGPSAASVSWRVALPQGRTKPLRYLFIALVSDRPLADAVALLPRKIDWSGERSFNDDLKAVGEELSRRGISMVVASHEAMP